VCDHPQRAEVDAALTAGNESYRRIAAQFGLKESSLRRHKAGHLPAALAQAKEAEAVTQGDNLLAQVCGLQARAMGILDRAEGAGDLKTALQAIAQARGCLELLAKLLGELQEGSTVNIVLLPEWVQMRGVIIAALGPYPEAKLRVAEALSHVGA
jgi:hypothetical protein